MNEPLWRRLVGETHEFELIYNTCPGQKYTHKKSRDALLELPVDWSQKNKEENFGEFEDLVAWRFDVGGLTKSLLQKGTKAMKTWLRLGCREVEGRSNIAQ